LTGVLFVVKIDPSVSATSFVSFRNISHDKGEEEVLFSMHSTFRIEQIKQIDENNRLWQVDLTMTSGTDPQLQALTAHIWKETKGSTGWFRLQDLMIRLAQYKKAEDLYEILLK